jgi:hypothetical protein
VSTADLSRLAPSDREYVDRVEDAAERETIVSTLLRHRRPDRLHAGDEIPALELWSLGGSSQSLDGLIGGRPLVLVFGSFT